MFAKGSVHKTPVLLKQTCWNHRQDRAGKPPAVDAVRPNGSPGVEVLSCQGEGQGKRLVPAFTGRVDILQKGPA